MARQATKIYYDDGTVQVIAPDPTPAPPPNTSTLIKGVYIDGIPDSRAKEFADQFGAGWVRTWFTVDWNKPAVPADFARIHALQAAGLKVLTVFTPPEKTGMPAPSPVASANWFSAALRDGAWGVGPDAWEIYNEPNLANYNADYAAHASSWITNALAPAYQVLHAGGQFVVSGGWSEGPTNGLAYAIQKGMLNYCDAVGYHPYGGDAPTQYQRIQVVRQAIGPNKPLWLTEWNLHMDPANPGTWTQNLGQAAAAIRSYVDAVFYFRLVQNDSKAGVAAPFDVNLNRRPIWYNGTVAAMNAL